MKYQKPSNPGLDRAPLAAWNDAEASHPDLIWWSRLDKRYQVECHRTGRRTGILCIFAREGKLLKTFAVQLRLGPHHGVPIEDLWAWQKRAEEFADRLKV